MTKSEFIRQFPATIEHKTWGYAELEIVADQELYKGACYRHLDKTTSLGVYATTWFEVYKKMREDLIKEGYLKE